MKGVKGGKRPQGGGGPDDDKDDGWAGIGTGLIIRMEVMVQKDTYRGSLNLQGSLKEDQGA